MTWRSSLCRRREQFDRVTGAGKPRADRSKSKMMTLIRAVETEIADGDMTAAKQSAARTSHALQIGDAFVHDQRMRLQFHPGSAHPNPQQPRARICPRSSMTEGHKFLHLNRLDLGGW